MDALQAQWRSKLSANTGTAHLSPEQLWQHISAASSFRELDNLCARYLDSASFSHHHLALAISRLPCVAITPADSQLLLMEKLTSKLGHGVNYLSADAISSVAWAFATVGRTLLYSKCRLYMTKPWQIGAISELVCGCCVLVTCTQQVA